MQNQLEIVSQELKHKSEKLNRKLIQQYRSVRRIAREKPEETVMISLVAGIIIGYLTSKIVNSVKESK
jgi:hypothetical protein